MCIGDVDDQDKRRTETEGWWAILNSREENGGEKEDPKVLQMTVNFHTLLESVKLSYKRIETRF